MLTELHPHFSKTGDSDEYKKEVWSFINNEEIMDRLEEIEFMDHSYAGKDWITLQELQNDPSLMSNNCFSAASEIYERFPDLGYFEVKFKDNKMHAANIYETEDGTKMVVDFTATQYDNDDPELEMPYIVTLDEWKEKINNTAMKTYGPDAHITKFLYLDS